MSDRAFLDTNVVVYAYDRRSPAGQRRAVRAPKGRDIPAQANGLG